MAQAQSKCSISGHLDWNILWLSADIWTKTSLAQCSTQFGPQVSASLCAQAVVWTKLWDGSGASGTGIPAHHEHLSGLHSSCAHHIPAGYDVEWSSCQSTRFPHQTDSRLWGFARQCFSKPTHTPVDKYMPTYALTHTKKSRYWQMYVNMWVYVSVFLIWYIQYTFSQDRAEKSCIGAQRCRAPVQGCIWHTGRGLAHVGQEAHCHVLRMSQSHPTTARIASSFLCMIQSRSSDLLHDCQLLQKNPPGETNPKQSQPVHYTSGKRTTSRDIVRLALQKAVGLQVQVAFFALQKAN